jgi:MoxR-like ATPase
MRDAYKSLVDLRERAKEEVAKVVLGQDRAVELLLVAALARGHVLVEGPPGSAKTLLGRAIAHMLGASFNRIQFTPDTQPKELVGEYVHRFGERIFEPGVVFTNVLLADEVNRTPPRTQSALLEAMQERQVTVEGRSHKLKDPFLVIATQNSYEHEGVFRLPESQLDRFLFKVELEYVDEEAELGMLDLPHDGLLPDMIADIHPMLGVHGLEKARYELNSTVLPTEVARYIVAAGRRTREVPGVQLGASSRSLIHLASASKAIARLAGRDTVAIEDVREIAPYVLRHRLIVDPRVDADDVLREALALEVVPASDPEPVSALS